MPSYALKEYKSIINKMKFIDSWFWCRYTLNAYQGCEHDCNYCDARSHKYYLHPDFEETIFVKKNAPEMLDLRISRARTLLPDVVAMSGVSDPYQPAEEIYRNTHGCLEVLAKHGWPVHLTTKSTRVLRDLKVIKRLAERGWASVSFTVTTTDEEMSRFLEPRAPLPEERFQALETIKREAPEVQTGLCFMPIVPYLEDSEKSIEAVVKRAKEAEVDYIIFSPGMTMRDNQALWFLSKLEERYPELLQKYEELYGFRHERNVYNGSYSPNKRYSKRVGKMVYRSLQHHGISPRMKRFIPKDFRKSNYLLAEKLLNQAYHNQMRGKPWSNTHWAAMNIQNLKESIEEVIERRELGNIRNMNEELEDEIHEFLHHIDGRQMKLV